MGDFDEERSCPVCLWEGDSKLQLTKHLKYAHSDVYAYNLSEFVRGFRFFSGETSIPHCEICNIYLGFDFEVEHQSNKNHLKKLSQLQYPAQSDELDCNYMKETPPEHFYDPANAIDAACTDLPESSAEAFELFQDACASSDVPANTVAAEHSSSGSSISLLPGIAACPQLHGENAAVEMSGDSSDYSEHIGETYLSCAQVSTRPSSTLERNTRELLERRSRDWRNWKTVRVVETSTTDEVSA
jgi:hypothetical protein